MRIPVAVSSLLFVSFLSASAQSIYGLAIDTSRLNGSAGKLVFEITSNRPLTNRLDIINFETDGTVSLPETAGEFVAGDLIQNLRPAKFTRMKANGFFTELALPFTAFGDSISFTLNVSETAPLEGRLPDEVSVMLVDPEGRSLLGRDGENGQLPLMALDITGERGGALQNRHRRATGHVPEASGDLTPDQGRVNSADRNALATTVKIVPAWTPDDASLVTNARGFVGTLRQFCNRRCKGETICTGGAFGISVDDETFYVFDDVSNLKAQVAIVDQGINPLREGDFGRVKVTGSLSNSVLTVLRVEVF